MAWFILCCSQLDLLETREGVVICVEIHQSLWLDVRVVTARSLSSCLLLLFHLL